MRITVMSDTLLMNEDIMGGLMRIAAFGWLHRDHGYSKNGKLVELVPNKGCLGQYKTAFDGEMEAIAEIMEFGNQIEIPVGVC
jgi:hypothetical protein